MKTCWDLQEKLVADEPLSAEEQRHLRDCPCCRDFGGLHAALLTEAGRPPLPEKRPQPVRRLRRLPALAGAMAVLGLVVALLVARPAVDYGRTAEELAALWDEVEQATAVADLTEEEKTALASGWLALEMERFDPLAEGTYWP